MSHFKTAPYISRVARRFVTGEKMAENNDERVPTNLRAMLILEAMCQQSAPLSASDVGRLVGIPKQTAHRLCTTLVDEGFLTRDDPRGNFRPGRRARDMASGILHVSANHLARHQTLEAVAKTVEETVNFVVPEDRGMSYKDRVETNWPFRIQLPIGSHVPFHCTASGKTFLASLPQSERRRLVHVMQLEALTENTITQPTALLDELKETAKRGYAIDDEEFYDGMVAIAVPVRDKAGRYFASIAVHGPSQRIALDDLKAHVPLLTEASQQLTAVSFD